MKPVFLFWIHYGRKQRGQRIKRIKRITHFVPIIPLKKTRSEFGFCSRRLQSAKNIGLISRLHLSPTSSIKEEPRLNQQWKIH